MVQLNPFPVFGAKNNTNTIYRTFFTEISVQMVKAQALPVEWDLNPVETELKSCALSHAAMLAHLTSQ